MTKSRYQNIFLLSLFLINILGVVRYILRWGEPLSSEGYLPTPTYFFWSWDALVLVMVAVVVLNTGLEKSKKYFLFFLPLLLFACISWIQSTSFYVSGTARAIILNGVIFSLLASSWEWLSIKSINKLIEVVAAFAVFFVVLQICLYYYYDILPTHSNECGLVRFGSIYNDSLVFGVMLPMFAGYFLRKCSGAFLLFLISFVVVVLSVMTGGMTAMAISLLYIFFVLRANRQLGLMLALVLLICVVIFKDHFIQLMNFKLGYGCGSPVRHLDLKNGFDGGSVAGHLIGWSQMGGLSFANLIGITPMNYYAESGYLSFLYNFGGVVLLLVMVFHIWTVLACRRILKYSTDLQLRAFAGGAEGLTMGILLASVNLPIIIYPPVYLWVVILSAIVIGYASNNNYGRDRAKKSN